MRLFIRSNWERTLLVCGKCSRKVDGGFGPKGRTSLAKALRRQHAGAVFAAGFLIAALVSIPILNLLTPLFGMALMVHLHKRLAGPRIELIEPERHAALTR